MKNFCLFLIIALFCACTHPHKEECAYVLPPYLQLTDIGGNYIVKLLFPCGYLSDYKGAEHGWISDFASFENATSFKDSCDAKYFAHKYINQAHNKPVMDSVALAPKITSPPPLDVSLKNIYGLISIRNQMSHVMETIIGVLQHRCDVTSQIANHDYSDDNERNQLIGKVNQLHKKEDKLIDSLYKLQKQLNAK